MILGVKGKVYSSMEMARALGITKRTLYRWLYDGVLPEPARISIGGSTIRLWSEAELKKARAITGQRERTPILEAVLEAWPQIRSAHPLQYSVSGSIHTFGFSTVDEEI